MLALCTITGASAQVRIGHNAQGPVNNAAVLELSNDLGAASSSWKCLVLPYVNFDSVSVFPDTATWGIAGTATDGAMVYNTGTRNSEGFIGSGVYVWNSGAWVSLQPIPIVPPVTFQDPGTTPGDTGYVDFDYQGQQVHYATIRAADGKIWLRKNLGAGQVATSAHDQNGIGHLFQWGRWDDGHQLRNSTTTQGSSSLQNPSHIPAGNVNFIISSTAASRWWGTGGVATDTWSGNPPAATNGKDPCTVIGTGWHMPTSTEWGAVATAEHMNDENSAFASRLKLPLPGYRSASTGTISSSFSYYWSGTALANGQGRVLIMEDAGVGTFYIDADVRGVGAAVRCIK